MKQETMKVNINKKMETMEFIKCVYYNMAAKLCLMRSYRHLTKATLLDNKAEYYVEKQKAIMRKYQWMS